MARRIGVTLAAAFIAVLTFAGAASAQQQQYPPEKGSLQVNKTEVDPGESVTVSGGGYPSNATITIRFDDQVLGTTQARADGTFSVTVTIPSNATPGSHTLTAVGVLGNGATRTETATINVRAAAAAAAAPTGSTLPRTGTGLTIPLAASSVLLIAAGSVAVVATRRRRLS